MILLHFLNLFTQMSNDTKNKTSEILKIIQNLYCLPVVIYATYSCYSNDMYIITTACQIIKYQLIFDFLLATPDVIFHHIAVLLFLYPSFKSGSDVQNLMPSMLIAMKTEMSTIFLSLHHLISKKYKTLLTINDAFFIFLFFYTRIYEYSIKLIYNKNAHENIDKCYHPIDAVLVKTGLYLLYIVNLYWGIIIIKTIVKKINESGVLLSFQQSESVIKYMYFSSLIACAILYKPFNNPIYFLDTIGVSILSVYSYEYHNALSKQVSLEKNVLDDDLIWYYINDIFSINIRCFLCVLTNTNLYKVLTTMAENMYMNMTLVYVSLIFHTASMYHFVKYLVTLKSSNQVITIYKNPSEKTQFLHLTKSLPILVDSIIMIYNTNDLYIRNNGILITVLFMIIMSVQPFYQMNHLAFHILLLFQTICLSQSNLYINEYV